MGDLEQRRPAPGNDRLSYAFLLERDSFALAVRGRSATLRTDVAYRARVWYDAPVLPAVGASCGLDGDAPRVRLAVTLHVRLTPDWALDPRTHAVVEPLSEADRDKCTITALGIDVTGDVVDAARAALRQKSAEAGARLAAVDVPGEARRVWEVLQRPIRLTDSLWLTVNPSAVRLGVLELRKDTLLTTVGLSANPRVTGGPRPAPGTRPLPPPREGTSRASALHLLTEAHLPYDVASSILTRELRGTPIQVAAQQLTVDSLRLFGLGGGKIAVRLGVSGPVDGVLYAVGHPAYDTATSTLFMPDLRYDVGTRDALTGALAWLGGEAVETFLRTRARIDLSPMLAEGRELLRKNLNRELAKGVRLRSDILAGDVRDVRAAPGALLVRAIVSGRSEIVVDALLPAAPRPPGGPIAPRPPSSR
jgi:hypothetical protein